MGDDKNLNAMTARFFDRPFINGKRERRYRNVKLGDHSIRQPCPADVAVHFSDIADVIIGNIYTHEVVVGCVAWLTHPGILSALGRCKKAAIVVQKEDFLRRDCDMNFPPWKQQLRAAYDKLPSFSAFDFRNSYPGQQELEDDYCYEAQHSLFDPTGMYVMPEEAVRCIGYARNDSAQIPRMHHKFMVFGDLDDGLIMRPNCVVTGSFNMTRNAVASRENVVEISNREICLAYLSEWAQLWCMSEALDWMSPEPKPDDIDMST